MTGTLIKSLIERRAAESDVLDFKRQAYGTGNKDHGELLKDITSFANSQGGRIILGVETDESGRATEAIGINTVDIDGEIERYENICRTSIQPALSTLKVSSESEFGQNFIIIDVGPSPLSPHRIDFVNSKFHRAYYVRRGRSCSEASAHEVRDMILNQQRVPQLIDEFFQERFMRLGAGKLASGIHALGPSMTIFAAPTVSFGTNAVVEDALMPNNGFKYGTPHSGYSARPNIFGAYCKSDSEVEYVQLHHNGVVEFYYGDILHELEDDRKSVVPGVRLLQYIWSDLPKTIRAYTQVIGAQMYNVRVYFNEMRYPLTTQFYDSSQVVPSEASFSLPDVALRVSDLGVVNKMDLKELSDLVWRCWGRATCALVDPEGNPVGKLSDSL